MAENKDSSSIFDFRTVLLAVVLFGGAYFIHTTLRSSRPTEAMPQGRTALGDQTIPARLWQDPLDAVLNYQAQVKSQSNAEPGNTNGAPVGLFSFTGITNQITRKLQVSGRGGANAAPDLTILEVMIEGGSYAESAEARYRSRYAVLSALSESGYIPGDAEHIGCFEVPWPRGACLEQITNNVPSLFALGTDPVCKCFKQDHLQVPFEWFQTNNLPSRGIVQSTNRGPLLLLWLRRDAFADYPLIRLAQLNHELQAGQINGRIVVKLIDPSLGDLLSEASERAHSESSDLSTNGFRLSDALTNVDVYSSWSTTPDTLLASLAGGLITNLDEGPGEERRGAVRAVLTNYFRSFINVTCTDEQLVDALIDELKLRGVNLTNGMDAVALVSEWDTFYGRALPLTFAAKAACRTGAAGGTNLTDGLASLTNGWPGNIWHSSYLRGVDGKLPGKNPGESKSPDSATKDQPQEGPNRPEGRAQLDYLPRLARQLKEMERRYEAAKTNQGKLKAIGILGSDVYDKLLVLQTLRPYFTDEIFFTTDLDARLLHSAESPWARNVIVASSFGLRLTNDLQGDIPPFRGTYQTAEYLACLAALNPERVATRLSGLSPRVFEIGRNGAFDLSPTNNTALYPAPHFSSLESPGWSLFWMPLALGLIATMLVITLSSGARDKVMQFPNDASERCFRIVILVVGLALIILAYVFAGVIYHDSRSAGGEPFSLVEGISIWPAEIIRFVVICLSVFFLLKGFHELKQEKDDLYKTFKLGKAPTWRLSAVWNKIRKRIRSFSLRISPKSGAVPKSVVALLRDYDRRGAGLRRLGRVMFAGLLYLFTAWLLMTMEISEKPSVPFRGDTSSSCDSVILFGSVFLQTFLIFFVVDASCLCARLIWKLWPKEVQITEDVQLKWPGKTQREFELINNMHPDYLSDWIGIQLIGERSEVVGKLIFYPFVVLSLMIVARTNFFAPWNWPAILILVFGLSSGFAVLSVLVLRRAAEHARRRALERMNQKLLQVLGGIQELPPQYPPVGSETAATSGATSRAEPDHETKGSVKSAASAQKPSKAKKDIELAEQIRVLIGQIEDYKRGAFAPLSAHPLIRALLLPTGGAGVMALLNFFASR